MAKPGVTRSQIGLLGMDTLSISDPDLILRAIATNELVRLTDSVPSLDGMPWIYRRFFPLSRFFAVGHGYFMPFRGDADPTYQPCRDYLDKTFALPRDVSEHVQRAAQLIADPAANPSDKELGTTMANAIGCRFLTDEDNANKVPDSIIDAAHGQAGGVIDAFLPWRFIPGEGFIRTVYSFFARQMQAEPELPPPMVTDVSHSVLASMLHGASVLREISKDPDENIESIMARLGPVEKVLRMVRCETTLDGIVPDGRTIQPGKTVVELNIRAAAAATGDVAWAFGAGTGERRCAAESVIVSFFKDVQAEVKRLRAN